MAQNPRYSFIIPALNEEKFIGRCIRSIQKQTGASFEIIVADNGSSDKTIEIAKSLGAQVVSVPEKGLSHARNDGARQTRGSIFCFIDADAKLSHQWLIEVEKTMRQKNVDFVSGLNIFASNRWHTCLWFNTYTLTVYCIMWLASLVGKPSLVGNNVAVSKKVFTELGGFPPLVAEDVYLTRKLWKLNYQGAVNLHMVVWYSSRGFEAVGYVHTLWYWFKSVITPFSQVEYSYKSKR